MAEAKVGDEFLTHEMDEAIAFQRCIVDAERQLSQQHPVSDVKQLLRTQLRDDERHLRELEKLGQPLGATGKAEEVVSAMAELMTRTLESAPEAESEAYEAQAVLLALKRKQQDAGLAMIRIARDRKDATMRDAATKFERAQRTAAKELGSSLADFARRLAAA
jgi:hypothetical protein